MPKLLYVLSSLVCSVHANSYAICGTVGCLVSEVLPAFALGSRVSPKDSSNISSAWLLPGDYAKGHPTLNGQPNLLDAFLASSDQQTASGFSFSSANNVIQVRLTGSVLAFGQSFYAGAAQSTIGSFIVSPTSSAVLKVANGPVPSISIFDSCSDTSQLGLGSKAVLTIDSASSAPCKAGQFGTTDNCQSCSLSCATCWGASLRQCLSCEVGQRLTAGMCRPAQCAGGASMLANLRICLEELDTYQTPTANKASSTTNTSLIAVPSAIGSLTIIALLVILYRRHTKSKSIQLASKPIDLHPWQTFGKPNDFVPAYAPAAYERSERSKNFGYRSSGSTHTSNSPTLAPWSVQPESDDGPAPDDDWSPRQLERRKRKELARLRDEIWYQSSAGSASTASEDRDWNAKDRKRRDIVEPEQDVVSGSPRDSQSSRLKEWRRDIILKKPALVPSNVQQSKIDLSARPVKPASTIFTRAANAQSSPAKESLNRFNTKSMLIKDWVSTPKDRPEAPKTVISLSTAHRSNGHTRKVSESSKRSGTQARSIVASTQISSPSLAPTSVSRNLERLARRQAAQRQGTSVGPRAVNVDGMTLFE